MGEATGGSSWATLRTATALSPEVRRTRTISRQRHLSPQQSRLVHDGLLRSALCRDRLQQAIWHSPEPLFAQLHWQPDGAREARSRIWGVELIPTRRESPDTQISLLARSRMSVIRFLISDGLPSIHQIVDARQGGVIEPPLEPEIPTPDLVHHRIN